MYYIKGIVKQPNSSDFIVVENNNIGYKIFTNEKCSINDEISLFINVNFNEEEISFVGFKDQMELEVFQILLSINGIGIKTALKRTGSSSLRSKRNGIPRTRAVP